MPVETIIRVSLLKKHIAGVLLIPKHPVYHMTLPASATLRWHTSSIQFLGYLSRRFSCEYFIKNPANDFCFLRLDDHLSVYIFVAVGRIPDLEGPVHKTLLYASGFIFGDGP